MSTDEREEAAIACALSFVASAPAAPELRERARGRLERVRSIIDSANIADYPLTINFHPDRPAVGLRMVIESMAHDGRVRNQFEIGISNGELGISANGRRRRRETQMFGGAYDRPDLDAVRPKYGSADLIRRPTGGWPRFGSSHLVLRESVLSRCTFSVGDGLSARSWVTTRDGLEELLTEVRGSRGAAAIPRRSWQSDGWVEMQVHGTLQLARDIEALVLDSSFRATRTQSLAERLCAEHAIPLRWSVEPRSDPTTWHIPAKRAIARAIVEEWTLGEHSTASTIGRLFYEDGGHPALDGSDAALRDAVARYFWNRTLLSRIPAIDRERMDILA